MSSFAAAAFHLSLVGVTSAAPLGRVAEATPFPALTLVCSTPQMIRCDRARDNCIADRGADGVITARTTKDKAKLERCSAEYSRCYQACGEPRPYCWWCSLPGGLH
ncbi:MAG TPA: hypothetical protein VKX28_21260 [Xanthobacteraceae bacterium]|nr:hypothetical protein [Xanthobacteraceae bacterium]